MNLVWVLGLNNTLIYAYGSREKSTIAEVVIRVVTRNSLNCRSHFELNLLHVLISISLC